ncbi:MAG: hypothetical protein OEL89_04950 [Candidatus Peregrinibacteria bacterium]|nr:hypothetical protein [Candidatus Peregrinibacteria bacterium]
MLLELFFATVFAAPMPSQSSDIDGDGFTVESDYCPNVPGTKNGCPSFSIRTPASRDDNSVMVSEGVQTTDFYLYQKTQIRVGDEVFAAVKDADSDEIYSQSASIEVSN